MERESYISVFQIDIDKSIAVGYKGSKVVIKVNDETVELMIQHACMVIASLAEAMNKAYYNLMLKYRRR